MRLLQGEENNNNRLANTPRTPKQKVQRLEQVTHLCDEHSYRPSYNNTDDKIGQLAARAYLVRYNWVSSWVVDLASSFTPRWPWSIILAANI